MLLPQPRQRAFRGWVEINDPDWTLEGDEVAAGPAGPYVVAHGDSWRKFYNGGCQGFPLENWAGEPLSNITRKLTRDAHYGMRAEQRDGRFQNVEFLVKGMQLRVYRPDKATKLRRRMNPLYSKPLPLP